METIGRSPTPSTAIVHTSPPTDQTIVLGGSWDLVSKVISPLIGVISNYKYSYLIYNPSY